jgi:uncharacterized coiled-coil protein SlyX
MATYEELLEIIKAQQKTIEKLTAELEAAREEIAELKEKLNKDSHNSSKPPSTDGYEKPAPRSQRKKSGKKAGGQTGHKGHHIDLGQPDRVERIYPQHCANCPHREYCTHLKVHFAVQLLLQKRLWTVFLKNYIRILLYIVTKPECVWKHRCTGFMSSVHQS